MPAALDLILTSGTVSLSDKNPFAFEIAEGFSPSEIVRYEQGGPTQDGVTDLGFTLQPRVMTLNLLFYATTDAILDSYRTLLMGYFKPLTNHPLQLRYTRDDGALRYLTVVAVDDIAISLVPEHRPGHLHRASLHLRAAAPLWYGAVKTPTYTGGSTQVWWTAGGLIGTANVMEHVEYPTQGQLWTYAGTLTGSWSVVFRTTLDATNTHAAFHAGTGALEAVLTKDARFYYRSPSWMYDGGIFAIAAASSAFDLNFQVVHDAPGGHHIAYYNGDTYENDVSVDFDISGTARRWRSDRLGSASTYWANAMPKAAIYDKALSQAERIALDNWMSQAAILGTITAVNAGDMPEYPFITITGPIINPILTNVTTGDAISLYGITVGAGSAVTIDLRTGDKLVTNAAGSSLLSSLVDPFDVVNFYLAPAPTATGGTNSIRVQGGSVSTSTVVTFTHYDRFLSI